MAVCSPSRRSGEDKILGWSWIFPPYTWQFSARAVETTRAIALDARCLRGKCEENPALGYELMKRFSAIGARRLQRTRMQILDMFGGRGFPGRRSLACALTRTLDSAVGIRTIGGMKQDADAGSRRGLVAWK